MQHRSPGAVYYRPKKDSAMDFKSLDQLLKNVAGLPIAQKIKEHQQLLQAWQQAVGPAIAKVTRPIAIDRDILSIATASAVLAQDLTFKRRQILVKLNPHLTTPVRDIRFSAQKWTEAQTSNGRSPLTEPQTLLSQHPSRIDPPTEQIISAQNTPTATPQQAFQAWATRIQNQSKNWPLCPQCQCPTPPGELEHWKVCGICAVKQMKP
jgi:predicted nucleic acid-binding Zn ribbon protein